MQKFNELAFTHDRELVDLLIEGSHKAFGELYARFKEQLLYFCAQYMDEADAEDIVQDIFLELWDNRHTLGAVTSISGYVFGMAKNYTMRKFRHLDVHSRFARKILTNETESTNNTEETILDNDYSQLLNDLIEQLTPKQKEVFRLSRIESHTYKEIAEMLNISLPAVQKHASLALKKIMEGLRQHADIHFNNK